MRVGDRVKQPGTGQYGVVTGLLTGMENTPCAWVRFDRRKKDVMRVIAVLERVPKP